MTDDELIPTAAEMEAALQEMPAWQVDLPPAEATEMQAQEEARGVVVPRSPGMPEASERPEVSEQPPPPLERILEALLFVGGPPLTLERAAEVVRGLAEDDFRHALDTLAKAYRAQGRPYHIQPRLGGYVLELRPRYQGLREKLFGGVREARLSQAAVDVLSLVAYKQPATRQEIDSLRGADSGSVLRQLVRHGLVAIRREEGETDPRYATTPRFLQMFGLTSLDDLPQTQDLQRL